MGAGLLLLLTLALAGVAYRARTSVALGLVVGVVLLVPGIISPPGAPGLLTVHRIVLLAALAGVLRRCRSGEVPWADLAPARQSYRLALVVGLFAILGVALAQGTTDLGAAARNWQSWVFQWIYLVGVVVLCRAAGSWRPAVVALVVGAGAAALVTVVENLTGQSYARAWYHLVPSLLSSDPAQQLATRGGRVRVRGAADFTLAWAWSAAAVVPVALGVAALSRGRRQVAALAVSVLLGASVLLTYSRGVVLPLVAAVLVMLLVVQVRRVRVGVTAALVVASLLVLTQASLRGQFTESVDRGSIDVRVQRFPALTEVVAHHPFRGVGMSGLASLGFPTTDSSYLLAYGETGMLGLAALVAVLACACAWPLRGAVSSDLSTRVVCVGVATGAVLLAAGALTFDAFTSPSVAELFWVLVGIGVAASEHVPVRAPVLTWPVRAAGVVALGVVGLLLALTAPRHVARTWQFETLDAYDATVFAPTYTGRQLRTSFCEVVETRLEGTGTAITCRPSGVAPEVDAPGQGLLRLSATSRAAGEQAAAAATSATSQLRQLHRLRLQARGDWQEGSPSVLRTAPAWLPVLGLVVLLPVGGRRRWEQ